ncbi:hypothetical protein ACIP98_38330 [Streptomyces sp. NPDC088354]|uniref:hypothetical protein n=1 Tax=Streptomyces sp. NPDC088354 TaxID=3365856 RepID=UPI00382B538A
MSIFRRLMSLDGAGTVRQGKTVADGIDVAKEVSGKGRQCDMGVLFGSGDPVVETVSVAPGHHCSELPDVIGEPIQFGIAFAQAVQLVCVLLP